MKDVRELYILKKLDDIAIKDMINLFKLQKENDTVKGRIIRCIRNLFEHG